MIWDQGPSKHPCWTIPHHSPLLTGQVPSGSPLGELKPAPLHLPSRLHCLVFARPLGTPGQGLSVPQTFLTLTNHPSLPWERGFGVVQKLGKARMNWLL
jgi:hypothetical protein